ncbi:IPT/TIG domain-containing protein [Bacteroides sp. GD17]|jgi:hypothetical protein|uniref:IPT/TIG domain-containing protein n=1 Tax=Bacteroides sp. GD17 TaxID=3139826 RepID=UPI00260073B0|nr:IPT/TIG domain-containing protein [uncultured Bacteroides sp.]
MKNKKRCLKAFCLLALLSCLIGCKDDDIKKDSTAFNNNLPIEIVGFEPQEVTSRSQFLIYGKNFGNDPSLVNLKLGGVETKVVNCNNECLYCMIPRNSNRGTIEISIGDQTAMAEERFTYISNTQVTTLCGYVDETGRYEVKDGSFDECGMNNPSWLSIDPKNPNHIYMIEEANSIRLIDMEKKEMSTVITIGQMNITSPRNLSWSVTGDTLFVNNWADWEAAPISITMLLRKEDFKKPHVLLSGWNHVISVSVHPQTGDIYFCQESDGGVYRYTMSTGEVSRMFTVGGSWIWIYPYFHPSGDFAYIIRPRDGVILKSHFNRETKELEYPSVFAGNWNWGHKEGVGTNASLGVLWQGAFVENDEYVVQHKEDTFDFYVADGELWGTHPGDLIWRISPTAEAVRYAGRGSTAMDGNHWGYVDGDLLKEVRFDGPHSIAYDEANKIFYIGDQYNHRIRQIIVE